MAEQTSRDEYWAGVIRDWRASGFTQKEFCRRLGIAERALNNWLYKSPYRERIARLLAAQAQMPNREEADRFIPVSVVAETGVDKVKADFAAIEVVLGENGPRIAVRPGFDGETLRRVVAALGARPC
jgi:transcriptional regulator with XRE-family HTH domain